MPLHELRKICDWLQIRSEHRNWLLTGGFPESSLVGWYVAWMGSVSGQLIIITKITPLPLAPAPSSLPLPSPQQRPENPPGDLPADLGADGAGGALAMDSSMRPASLVWVLLGAGAAGCASAWAALACKIS